METIQKDYAINAEVILSNLNSDITLTTHSGKNVSISATGTKEDLKNLEIFEEDGVVNISSAGNNVINSDNSSITVYGNNNFIIQGSNSIVSNNNEKMKLIISMPETSSLSIKNISGDVNCGSLKSYLQAKVSGCSRINVASLEGNASLSASGSGKIKIETGNIQRLTASASGASKISVDVDVEVADLTASGASKITIRSVVDLSKSKSGAAKIKIKNN